MDEPASGRATRRRLAGVAAVAVAVGITWVLASPQDMAADREPERVAVPDGHARGGPTGAAVFAGPAPALEEVMWELELASSRVSEAPHGFSRQAVVLEPGVVVVRTPTALVGLDADTGRTLWLRDGVGDRAVHAVGDIAVLSTGQEIVGLEAETGRQRWEVPWASAWVWAAAPDAVVAAGPGDMAALDPADGTEMWRVGTRAGQLRVSVSDGVVVHTAGGWVSARDARSGRQLWAVSLWPVVSPVLSFGLWAEDGVAVVAVHDGPTFDTPEARAFDIRTGEVLWTQELQGRRPVFVLAGHLVLWQPESVTGLSLEDGSTGWQIALDDFVDLRRAEDDGGELYLLSNRRRVVTAYDPSTGDQLWAAGELPIHNLGDIASVTSSQILVWHPPYLVALPTDSGSLLWRANLSLAPTCGAVTANGVVYVPSGRGLLAVDAETGDPRWEYGPFVRQDIDVANVATDGDVMALFTAPHTLPLRSTLHIADARDGLMISATNLLGSAVGPPIVLSGDVVVAGNFMEFGLARMRRTGRPVWDTQVEGRVRGYSAVGEDGVVVATSAGVIAFDLSTGEQLWETPRDDLAAWPPAVASETVLVVVDDHVLLAVDAPTGQVRWESSVGAVVTHGLAATDDAVYVVAGDALGARAMEDGRELWRAQLDVGPSGPPAVVDETLLIATGDGRILAFDRHEGTPSDAFDIGRLVGGPFVVAEGRIHACSLDGELITIR